MKLMSEQIRIWKEKLNASDEEMTWIAENVLAQILESVKYNEEAKKAVEIEFKQFMETAAELNLYFKDK